MTIERCKNAGSGFECVRLAGHDGACDLVSSEAFAKAMQAAEDYIVKGEQGVTPREGGLFGKRADVAITDDVKPVRHELQPGEVFQTQAQWSNGDFESDGGMLGAFPTCPENEQVTTLEWDVAFPLSLSERVEAVRKYTVEELCKAFNVPLPVDHQDENGRVWDVLHAAGINSAGGLSASEGVKQLADKLHAVKKLANERFGRTSPLNLCDKCNGCGWEQPDVAIEVCSKCGGKGVLV